jgi:predicted adenylyl cyclase CyaB
MKNLELKAIAPSLARLRRRLRAFGATRQRAPLDQVDWYFQVPQGRMKLRQRKGEKAGELIFSVRPDAAKARTSDYQKLPVADPAGMRRLLEATFTPGACVRKRRDLWLHEDTRIHLDRVEGLGSFVEIEVPFARDAVRARRAMQALTDCLGIAPGDVVSCSYADLLAGGAAGKAQR